MKQIFRHYPPLKRITHQSTRTEIVYLPSPQHCALELLIAFSSHPFTNCIVRVPPPPPPPGRRCLISESQQHYHFVCWVNKFNGEIRDFPIFRVSDFSDTVTPASKFFVSTFPQSNNEIPRIIIGCAPRWVMGDDDGSDTENDTNCIQLSLSGDGWLELKSEGNKIEDQKRTDRGADFDTSKCKTWKQVCVGGLLIVEMGVKCAKQLCCLG